MTGILTNAEARALPVHSIGSSRLRGELWVDAVPDRLKLWEPNQKFDALILQKASHIPQSDIPIAADICDLDVRNDTLSLLRRCKVVSVCSQALADFYAPLISPVPVLVIDDVVPESLIKTVTSHSSRPIASLIWFGYHHNSNLLSPWMGEMERLGISLTCVSNRPVEFAHHNIKFESLDQVVDLFGSYDAALLPSYKIPMSVVTQDGWKLAYKTLNKTYLAAACHQPVVSTIDQLKLSGCELFEANADLRQQTSGRGIEYLTRKLNELLDTLHG